MMTLRQEKELEAKGYKLGKECKSRTEAKKAAQELREQGHKARVAEYSTSVKGYHDFFIWYK